MPTETLKGSDNVVQTSSGFAANARLIEVIEARLERRGRGVPGDIMRIITQYYTKDGQLLAEVDPLLGPFMDAVEGRIKTIEDELERERTSRINLRTSLEAANVEVAAQARMLSELRIKLRRARRSRK